MKLGHSDVTCSKIIMGTWQTGGEYWVGVEDATSIRAIHAALDAGITTFDTAEEYGSGHSERVLGQALAGRRQQAVLLSKVFSDHLGYDQVIAACERSLKQLRTDYLDLYQIHWPSGSFGSPIVPIAETMSALCELKAAGKIRAIGVSNFTLTQLAEACALGPVDSLQSPYSLLWRQVEQELLPFCRNQGLSLLAYSPLAQGILAGRFGTALHFEEGDHRHANKLLDPAIWPRVHAALAELRELAQSRGVSMAQLALAALIADERVCAIAGARTAEQVKDNARALQLALSTEEIARLRTSLAGVAELFADDPMPWTWEV